MSTKDYAYQLLKAKVTELHSEALAQRSMFQFGKGSGIGATALGVVGCIGFPPLGVLATVGGLGLWLTSVATEAVTTGDITPLPWVSTRLTAIASALDRASDHVATTEDKELAEYLSDEEQVLYLLLVTQGARVAELLSHVDEDLWDTTLTAIVTKAKQMFGKGGFVLESALSEGGEFLDHSAETLSIPLPARPQIATQPVTKQLVGEQTRLTAVDVAVVEPQSTPEPTIELPMVSTVVDTLEDVWTTVEPQLPVSNTAVDAMLAKPYESKAIFGAQRTGKSFLAATVSLKLSEDQGVKIYHLNLASWGDEDSIYWQHCTKSLCVDLVSLDASEAVTVIQNAIALVKEWFAIKDGSILIVDEIAYIGSKANKHALMLEPLLKLIADKITALASSGTKRKKAIWTIAPEIVASTLTDDAKAVKKLDLVYVTIAPTRFVDWEGNKITFNASLFEQVKYNYPITPPNVIALPNSDRVCYVNGKWLAVGELPTLAKV